ncbi:HIT family protein [Lactobacillus xylocopicola]|uniref:DeoR family transcriptional regulator n=1 Tax=Lactobacillus xylocopicola TaxID=2976676 RepID=A0ABN6SJD5_9LACO|nr:HIT domain-containing protein [Lactobacillus xylocopicola]BDR60320.1 DeoR family transcriptional regulator [Lactobacillus xylocopicola]
MVITELAGGYVVMGDTQFLPGYCVLLPKRHVASLNDLKLKERVEFLKDMSLLGDAILKACRVERINYDILGNTDHFLHAHVFPRYKTETAKRLTRPVWLYEPCFWTAVKYQYDDKKHGEIRQAIAEELKREVEEKSE